ncbi:hypothetical protein DBV15_11665 [Temnothorax longispinosus]|uniref:Aminopeptidase N-like N-terminal domain-containing protein n=1 Tax=Temnothorax longispinosus TaxID=300112 RepID=A0A4S2L5H8_9HYME|nr:hypothetical protein DBV15_11665 [Temnothorax longispinosus]
MTKLVDSELGEVEENGINEMANDAISAIVKCLDDVAPNKEIVIRKEWQGKSWFSDEIHKQLQLRDMAYRAARINKCSPSPMKRDAIYDNCEASTDLIRFNKRVNVARKAAQPHSDLAISDFRVLLGNLPPISAVGVRRCDDFMTRPELLKRTTTEIEGRTKFMRRTDVAIFGDSPITCLDTEGGLIRDRLLGFHYSTSLPKAGELFHACERMAIRWEVATDLWPMEARRLFPCFDEPILQANFSILIKHPKSYKILSNMPKQKTSITEQSDMIWTHFENTSPIPTYHVSAILFSFFSSTTTLNLNQLSHIAIPSFRHDAVSNLGLISYS